MPCVCRCCCFFPPNSLPYCRLYTLFCLACIKYPYDFNVVKSQKLIRRLSNGVCFLFVFLLHCVLHYSLNPMPIGLSVNNEKWTHFRHNIETKYFYNFQNGVKSYCFCSFHRLIYYSFRAGYEEASCVSICFTSNRHFYAFSECLCVCEKLFVIG